ncbi:6256_t:CDS:2, partial [Acaulospora morrowiae]
IRTRALENINNLKILIQGILIPTSVQMVDSKDEILILENNWFEKVKARIYIDKQKLVLKYKSQMIKVLITNNRARKVSTNKTDDYEQYNEEWTDKLLNKIIYEKKKVKVKEGDLGSNDETRSEGLSPTMYFIQVRESLPLEEEKLSEEVSIEKGNKASIIMEESSHTEDEQIIKSAINFDTSMLEEDAVVLIEELPMLMEPTQEKNIKEKIKKLEMDDKLKEEQVGQIKNTLKQGPDIFVQSVSELDCTKIYSTTLLETKGDKGKE